MLVVSTSGIPRELAHGLRPWHFAKERRGPPRMTARVNGSEARVCFDKHRKPVFATGKGRSSTKRLKGFGGVFKEARDHRPSKLVTGTNGDKEFFRIVPCEPKEDENIVLGFFCGAKGERFVLNPVDTEIVFEKRTSLDGCPVIAFAARMENERSYVLAANADGVESFVDVFTLSGYRRIDRDELQLLQLEE